jgi:hypothetical protein
MLQLDKLAANFAKMATDKSSHLRPVCLLKKFKAQLANLQFVPFLLIASVDQTAQKYLLHFRHFTNSPLTRSQSYDR